MGISGAIGAAVSGMRHQANRLGTSAQNVANASQPGYEAERAVSRADGAGGVATTRVPSGQSVSFAQERVEQVAAAAGYKANAAVVRVADDMLGSVIDAFA